MKKWILLFIVIVLLAGFTTAERGIDPALETQGLKTHTVIDVVGGLSSKTSLEWWITDDLKGLNGVPPLEDSSSVGSIDVNWEANPVQIIAQGQNTGATLYTSVYTENTDTNGVGNIGYTKDFGVDTKAVSTGQSNIEALKQLQYIGENGSRILSNDFIDVRGAGAASPSGSFGVALNAEVPEYVPLSANNFICPFGGGSSISDPFCNEVQAKSSIDMNIANVMTNTNARFVVPSADTPVALSHDIQVTDSIGKASAGIDATIHEGSSHVNMHEFSLPIDVYNPITQTTEHYTLNGWVAISSNDLVEEVSMHDFTSIDGVIDTFDKSMNYNSGALV
jgi:hypothetical protein